ncbi:MAG: MBL fold metallo-hydrolase RNA specificity domain-containing protein, partial [Micrococcales bacterium]
IISASGMATGGRVVHHLRDMLPNPKHTVILVGYQAVGTRGRSLVDGVDEVKMHGEMVPVRAQIASVQEFSVHVDGNELMAWVGTAKDRIGKIFVVHGEEGASEAVVERFERELHIDAIAPNDGQKFSL